MTTQEAIEQLKLTRAANKCNYADKYILDAFDMAIRSLEADRTVEKALYAIREEMQYIKVAEMQIYGKASWRFTSAIEDIITKHLKEVENERTDDNSGL